MEHPDLAPAVTPSVRTPQCGHTVSLGNYPITVYQPVKSHVLQSEIATRRWHITINHYIDVDTIYKNNTFKKLRSHSFSSQPPMTHPPSTKVQSQVPGVALRVPGLPHSPAQAASDGEMRECGEIRKWWSKITYTIKSREIYQLFQLFRQIFPFMSMITYMLLVIMWIKLMINMESGRPIHRLITLVDWPRCLFVSIPVLLSTPVVWFHICEFIIWTRDGIKLMINILINKMGGGPHSVMSSTATGPHATSTLCGRFTARIQTSNGKNDSKPANFRKYDQPHRRRHLSYGNTLGCTSKSIQIQTNPSSRYS